MADVPIYLNLIFIFTTLLTVGFFYVASQKDNMVLGIILLLMFLQGLLAYSGFFLNVTALPPRIVFILLPAILLMLYAFFTQAGKAFIKKIDMRIYTLLHIVRIPVEFTILGLFMYKLMPQTMTFEGRNFDILSGITAPIITYIAWKNGQPKTKILLIWNFICLALVIQIVGTGILSAPTPFQQFSFEQPNTAVLYFPFIWLPGIVVPIVFFGHFVAISRYISQSNPAK